MHKRRGRLAGVWIGLLLAAPLWAQGTGGTAQTGGPAAKTKAFDVVSIRENTGPAGGPQEPGPTADGYRMRNISLAAVLLTAYVPTGGNSPAYDPANITGLPDWIDKRFDIDARVSDADRAAWQDPIRQKAMMQEMLQVLLVERCKLVVHRESKEGAAYFLVLGKGGPKFKETDPAAEHAGQRMPFGGVISPGKDGLNLLDAPMDSVAYMLTVFLRPGRPVIDRTGLKGHYDVPVVRGQVAIRQPSGGAQDATAASDPGGGFDAVLGPLGLRLESGKAPVEMLVIDHMERPSEN